MFFQGSLKSLLIPIVLASIITLASPSLSPYVLHERRSQTPPGWSLTRRHDASATIPLRFGLKQSNLHKIDDLLYDVSHPTSANYGKHWTPARVAEAFAPNEETIDIVRDWLILSGIAPERIGFSASKGWIEINATVEEAESLMNTEYHVYTHETGKQHIACDEYHLPLHVSPHVDIVYPSVQFDARIKDRKRSAASYAKLGKPGMGTGPKVGAILSSPAPNDISGCGSQITPDCIRALYNISYTPVSGNSNSFAVVEYSPQAYFQSDLQTFFEYYSPDLAGRLPIEVDIDGGYQQTEYQSFSYDGEASLDLQYGMSLITPAQNVTLYQVNDNVESWSFDSFLDAIDGSYCTYEGGDDPVYDPTYPDPLAGGYKGPAACGTVKPASVISTSYYATENYLTAAYASRQCNEYAKLGLMGITILYCSGDYGVAGYDNVCQGADGNIFNPTFPGTCPYVTSVGATQIQSGQTVSDPEVACEEVIYSGGGFSNYFSIPDYQKSVVQSYLDGFNSTSFTKAVFNSSGTSRAYPDLSANGANYLVVVNSEFWLVYGTSASTPVVGVMLTMVNDARIAAGKAPVGFINPTIYDPSFASVFNDITSGTNPGCGTPGFSAGVGWDPVTGLGTPDLGRLMEAYLALP